MEIISQYFKKIGWKRFVVMVIGNICIGIGAGLLKFGSLGNDPYLSLIHI